MTVLRHQRQLGTALAARRTLKRREQNSLHASYSFPGAVGAKGGKPHWALKSDQFAHGCHRAAGSSTRER